MTRLGAKLPFAQAVEEVWYSQKTAVKEGTVRGMTYRHGEAAEAIERAKVEALEKEGLSRKEATRQPETVAKQDKKMVVSSDGAFVHLTSGEWREIKMMVVGEFASQWNAKAGEFEVKTSNLSYFSRSYRIREFERYTLAELSQRGVNEAKQLVSVNDGSAWIESLNDYHFLPSAVTILDFRHALDHLAQMGRLLLGEGSPRLAPWLEKMATQLKHKPPSVTLNELSLLKRQLTDDADLADFDAHYRYLASRSALIDYPHFRAQHFPIGSGSAESAHKVVVHCRMKQAGMRWAAPHLDPLLTLRNLICNGRWSQGWSDIAAHYWQQCRRTWCEQARRRRFPAKVSAKVLTLADVKVAPVPENASEPSSPPPRSPYRPAPDHPWRLGLWPSPESWRWN